MKAIWVRAYFVKENEVPLWQMDGGGTMLIPHFFWWDYGSCNEYYEKDDDVFMCAWNRKEGISKQREWKHYFILFFLLFPFQIR